MFGVEICMFLDNIGVVRFLKYLFLFGLINISLVRFVSVFVEVLIIVMFLLIWKVCILGVFIGE